MAITDDEKIYELIYTHEEVRAVQQRLRANSWRFVGKRARIHYDHLQSSLD